MTKKNLIIFMIGQIILTTTCAEEAPEPVPYSYDFSHVNLAIRYFDGPSEMLLAEIASTTAAVHLKRHSDRTGYYPSSATSRDITTDLLNKAPAPDTLGAVRKLVRYAERKTLPGSNPVWRKPRHIFRVKRSRKILCT